MLTFFRKISVTRRLWLLVAAAAFAPELAALWFQHVLRIQPCVMCIYERCALAGILLAGLAGAVAPVTPLRYGALALWAFCAWQGLALTREHILLQLHPSPFTTCDFAVRFPEWLPLDRWLPQVFAAAGGDCAVRSWTLWSLGMPQWLAGIFAASLIVAVTFILAQFRWKKT